MIARIFAVAALSALPGLASADPSVTAEQFTKHFTQGLTCDGKPCLRKTGATRKVCIGTDTLCQMENKAHADAKADPGAFDMLITFELGSDQLSAQARENLAEFAKAMKGEALKGATFNIDGHTDKSGYQSFDNQGLSERRAASVVRYLESLGVTRDRLNASGHGYQQPRTDDPFDGANRRVEATLRLN